MFCGKCGNSVPDGSQFCGNCGNPMPGAISNADTPSPASAAYAAPKTTGGSPIPRILRFVCLALAVVLSGVVLFTLINSVSTISQEVSFYAESQAVGFSLACCIPLCVLLLLLILSDCILASKLFNAKTKHQDRASLVLIFLSIVFIICLAIFIIGIAIPNPDSSDMQTALHLLSTVCANMEPIATILAVCALACMILSTKLAKKDPQ